MTLNQLSYFYQAATLQHFNQAAEKLNISEPSLSRSISALEDELGVILFEKKGRNVILTKAGQIFFEHTEVILNDIKRAENKMKQIATDGRENYRSHRTYWINGIPNQTFQFTSNAQ